MRSFYLVPLLALAAVLSSNAFSRPPAAIKFGRGLANSAAPAGNELASSLDRLRVAEPGAERSVPACYEGKRQEVCALLTEALAERNVRERLDGRLGFELTACERDANGAIAVDIVSHAGAVLVIPPIPHCG